ncbi:MAG TPA: sulfite exporter TauE/SafE family protein [Kofleriaceae bacterium]
MTAALLAGIFATSVVGSVHCIAMCGPLVGLHGGAKTTRLAMTHSLGRLTTYVAFGAIAGLVGSAVNLAGHVANMQRAATILAAAVIVGMGVYQIVDVYVTRARGRERAVAPQPTPFAKALVRIRPKSAVKRSYMIGTLTGLIPCGWLWAFVITAAGTASPVSGALVMFAFWLGTVPAMVGVLRVTGPLLARVRARMPAVTAVALIAIGLGTLALRWRDAGTTQVNAPHCHCHSASETTS